MTTKLTDDAIDLMPANIDIADLDDLLDGADEELLETDDDIIEDLTEGELIEEIKKVSVEPVKKINYLNNKDMLKEIHKSKASFSEYTDDRYVDYDIIVETKEEILLPETLEAARSARANRLAVSAFDVAMHEYLNGERRDKPKAAAFKLDASTIKDDEIVFRVLTYEHIPLAPGRKKNPKRESDNYAKLNFYPYKHYILNNSVLIEVGRSHSKKGQFNLEKGSITNKLARMFLLMVNKYGQRGNWRGYTYLEEMKGQSLVQLSQMALQFDEYKSSNPFAYFTASISNSFTRILNIERKNHDLRDDLLINGGVNPSFSRQLEIETKMRLMREDAIFSAKDDTL